MNTKLRFGIIAVGIAILLYASGVATAVDSTKASSTSSARADYGCSDVSFDNFTKVTKRIQKPAMRYPNAEMSELGEGWVKLDYTIDNTGVPVDFHIVEGLGAPVYAQLAIEGLSTARYEPAEIDGTRIDLNASNYTVTYRIEGENRAAVHSGVDLTLERAYALRQAGKFQESLDRLREAFKGPLNLYEQATLSFGIAISYKGLGDYRRALLHAKRATADRGDFADRGVRRNAFVLLSELQARDNNPLDALCAMTIARELDSRYEPEPALQSMLTAGEEVLKANTPVRTEVQLVESERTDVPANWYHPVLRADVAITPVEGKLSSLRLWCSTAKVKKPIQSREVLQIDPSAWPCILHVYGESGAKFVVEETGPNATGTR